MKGTNQSKAREPKRGLTKLWATVVVVGLVAALTAACNGGGGDNSSTVQPTGTGSPGPQPTGQAATGPACQALASLDKYRYVANVTLEVPEEIVPEGQGQPTPVATLTRAFEGRFYFPYDIDASFISPDKVAADITASNGVPFDMVVIGDTRWVTVGDQWQEVGPEYAVPYRPLDICNNIFPLIDLGQTQGEKEDVNGVSALHYTFADVPAGESMAAIFGAGSDMDILFQTLDVEVWLAEKGGWPVRMDIQTSGLYGDRRELKGHIRFELRDINAKDIKVEAPI